MCMWTVWTSLNIIMLGGGGGGSLYSDVQVEQVGTYWGRGLGTVCLFGEGAREGGGEGVSGALPRDHPYEQKGWKHYLSATSLAGGNKYNVIIIMQRQKANWKGSRNREHILQKRHRRSLKSWKEEKDELLNLTMSRGKLIQVGTTFRPRSFPFCFNLRPLVVLIIT